MAAGSLPGWAISFCMRNPGKIQNFVIVKESGFRSRLLYSPDLLFPNLTGAVHGSPLNKTTCTFVPIYSILY
jgi:hypothetical protein